MEPQLYRCGNGITTQCMVRWHGRFNGAATLSLRKFALMSDNKGLYHSFNEAATLSLWKYGMRESARYPDDSLQWGRNFIVAETLDHGFYAHIRRVASMGPQLYRCGNGAVTPLAGLQLCPCFNGAATLSLRKSAKVKPSFSWKLQWGRNFIVAEIRHRQVPISLPIWLQWGRNFIVAEIR